MVQARVRALPSRVVVYLLLAAALFAELGYGQVWARMTAGLDGIDVADPVSSALVQARRRIGVKPLRELFDLVVAPPPVRRDGGACWYARSTARRCSPPTPRRTWPRSAGPAAATARRGIRCCGC